MEKLNSAAKNISRAVNKVVAVTSTGTIHPYGKCRRTSKLACDSEFVIRALNGSISSFGANMPDNAEFLCIKYDLFSNQLLAIVRSGVHADVPTTGYRLAPSNLRATWQSR